jgi:hypothetical protein
MLSLYAKNMEQPPILCMSQCLACVKDNGFRGTSPASFQEVDQWLPCPVQAKDILPVHVLRMQLEVSGLPDHPVRVCVDLVERMLVSWNWTWWWTRWCPWVGFLGTGLCCVRPRLIYFNTSDVCAVGSSWTRSRWDGRSDQCGLDHFRRTPVGTWSPDPQVVHHRPKETGNLLRWEAQRLDVPGQKRAHATDSPAAEGQEGDRDEPLGSRGQWTAARPSHITTDGHWVRLGVEPPFWGLMTISESPWDISVDIANLCQATQRISPENDNLHTRRHEKLESHPIGYIFRSPPSCIMQITHKSTAVKTEMVECMPCKLVACLRGLGSRSSCLQQWREREWDN